MKLATLAFLAVALCDSSGAHADALFVCFGTCGGEPIRDDEGMEFRYAPIGPTHPANFFWYSKSDGSLMVELGADGSIKFGDGVSPRDAANFVAGLLSNPAGLPTGLAVDEPPCKGFIATNVPGVRDYKYTEMFMSNRPKEFHIGLTTDGIVEYFNINPSPQEDEFFQLLADRLSCPSVK